MPTTFGHEIGSGFSCADGGRLSTVTVPSVVTTYFFDPAGNVEASTVGATRTEFEYDPANRLVNRALAGSVVETYTWGTEHGYRTRQGPTSIPAATVLGYSSTGRLTSYATSARERNIHIRRQRAAHALGGGLR